MFNIPTAGKRSLKLCCVPEQINIPIFLAIERQIFQKFNLDVKVQIVHEGTGKMIDLLERNDSDIALVVTDAFLVAKSQKRKVQLCGTYADSFLTWAVATSPRFSSFLTVNDFWQSKLSCGIKELRVGISRKGSGSHSMAFYMSKVFNICGPEDNHSTLSFHIADDFAGLRRGVLSNLFDLFLWEKYTTKPYFDNHELHKLGEVESPWPSFSIVSRIPSDHSESSELFNAIKYQLFPALIESTSLFSSMGEQAIDRIISEHHHTRVDAEQWFSNVRYSPDMSVKKAAYDNSLQILELIKVLSNEKPLKFEDLYNKDNTAIVIK